ncbi:carboxypeptidase regulatory-like domain-containing protein [Pedosphaera parvula]|nr:carboxypeptidase regulatory-like domain-containing protein [Pedosphaera parvula]
MKHFICSLSRARQALSISACLFTFAFQGTATAQALQQVVQQFFVPFPETDFQNSVKGIDTTGTPASTDLNSIISIAVGTTNTVIIYDHWEDGYENDINNPIQLTTQIWGDGNTNNGVAPGHPNDILQPGDVIVLTNIVSLPRNPSVLKYDGRDRIAATKAVTVTRAAWALSPGTLLMSGTEVYDTTRWGTFFKIPVGTNVNPAIQSFSYSSLHIIASQNGTTLQVDTNGDGVPDRTTTLNIGDSYFVNGGVAAGATVTASKPVQVHQMTGRIGSTYQSRTFAIRPFNQWDTSYYAPVGTSLSSEVHDVFVFNPYSTNINVLYATKVGTGALSVPAGNNYKFPMPLNSGAHFYTTNGLPFYAVGANDAGGTNTANNTHDWGYALLPEAALTPLIVVGWAPGSDDLASPAGPDANGSPVWITPTKPTTIYVNYSGNYTVGPNIAPNGQHYNVAYSLAAYQFQTVYNPTTKNMTGARIFTADGTTFAAAWGEDASKAGCCAPYFDAGNTIIPFPVPKILKTSRLAVDLNGDGLSGWGDTLEYTVHVQNEGMLALGNVLVLDGLPSTINYVPNSTTVNGVPVADNLVPPANTAFPLDENGLVLPQILVGGYSDIKFRTIINSGITSITNTVSAEGAGQPVISTDTVVVSPSTNQYPTVTIAFTDASGTPVSSYLINNSIYVKLTDTAQNTNASTAQTLVVAVTNLSNGDVESVTLAETGVNTGIFQSTAPLASSTTSGAGAHDGTLLALSGNALQVGYTDPITANSDSAHATVSAAALPAVTKRSQLVTDLNNDGRIGWGDTVEYTIALTNSSAIIITNPVVSDTLPANVTYVTGTSTTNGVAIGDSGVTPFPLDESGFQLQNIPANGAVSVKFRVTVNSATSISNSVLVTTANGSVQAQDVAAVLPPPPSCNLSFSDALGNSVIAYAQNSSLYVTLSDTSLNIDSTTAQTLTLLVKNISNGDVEFVTLTETGTNTGVFRNTTPLPSSTTTGSGTQDGTLYAQPGQNLQVDHNGALGENCSATASIVRPVEIKKLYLSDPGQSLDRIDPVATADTTTANSSTLVGASSSFATITLNASSSTNGNGSSLTFAHTTGAGTNGLLLVGVSTDNSTTVSSVTYGGINLTNVGGATAPGNPKPRAEIWSLPNPPVGSNNVVVTLSGSANIVAGAATFTGVSQTAPLGNFTGTSSSSGSPSVSVSSASGELVFDTVSAGASVTPGAGQTQRWNQTQAAISGGSSTQPGAASTTMAWTVNDKWAIGVVPIKPASISSGGGSGTNNTLFTQSPAMCKSFILPAGQTIAVTNYVQVTSGSLSATPNVTAVLQYGGTTFATLINPIYNSGSGTLAWMGTLTTNVTVPPGQAITLWVTNNEAAASFSIQYDSTTKPSAINLPTTTIINIDALDLYDAPYPAGNPINSAFNGQTVYVRSSVSDPFGSYDVTHAHLSITDPGLNTLNVSLTNSSVVADDGCVKTYEYAWDADSFQGVHNIQAIAYEGTEGITNSAGISIVVAFPDGGTPSVTTFIDALDNPTYSYNANQTICVEVVDANMNQNPTAVETVTAVITTSSGDSETIILSETDANSGVFKACIPANTSATVQNDGTLNAPAGSGLTVTYTDPTNPLDTSSDSAIIKTVASPNPVISLFKTLVDPANGNVLLGQNVQFNIQVVNPGSVTVTNVKLTDTFPSARLQFVSATLSPDGTTLPGTLTWTNLGPLNPGQSVTISTFFTASSAGPVTNSVSVSGTTNVGPVLVAATNISPAISLTKTLVSPLSGPAYINDTLVYQIAVTNIGNTTITSWPLQDQFSASCFQFVGASVPPTGSGGGILLWTGFPSLVAGASTNIYVTNKVTGSCEPALNTADISFGVDQFGNPVPPVQSIASITNIGANISGTIYYDANSNGTNDFEDSPLYNVIAYVDLNNDGVRQPIEPFTLTATNGQYQITSLAATNYVVRVDTNTLPAGVRPTYDLDGTNTANAISLTVTNGQNITNVDFGYIGSGSISGYLWNDINGDGILQSGEPLLSGVKVFVDVNGNGVREAGEQFVVTAADGSYLISNLVSNTYRITVDLSTLPTGVNPTFDADGIGTPDVVNVVLDAGQDAANVNFGYMGSANLNGLVTDILTGQPVTAATLSVVDGLVVTQTATSDLTGFYTIPHLWVGAATETVSRTGYVSTNLSPTIVSGPNTVNVQLTPNTLTGLVTDAMTAQPIVGVTVQLIDNLGMTNTATTDGTGHYSIAVIAVGSANVTASKVGYASATATPSIAPGANTLDLQLSANTLTGLVTDAFTSQPIAGAKVQVIDAIGQTNTIITDATGQYGVTNIAVGSASITASKTGYLTSITTPTIVVGTNTQNLTLTPNTLTGVVTDAATSQPIVGASVQVVDAAGATNVLSSGPTGQFGLTNIAAGAATVTVTKAAYYPTNATPTFVSGPNTLNLQLTLIPQADVVTTSTGPASVVSGANFTYTITLTNLGPATASNVVASDALPLTGTFVSASDGGTNNGGVVTWPVIAALASGGTTNFTVTFAAPVSGTLTNIASSAAATGDPDLTNNNGTAPAATVITTVTPQADIAVLKTGNVTVLAGGNLTYTITITNLGPSTASNVVVSDTLPLSVTFVSASDGGIPTGNVVNWPAIDSLANGAVTNFTVTVQAPVSGSFTNTASATSSTGDPVPSNNDGSSIGSTVTTTVTPQADIAVLKTGNATVLAGGNLTYTITVTNLGPSTASNVVVSDTLPLSVTFVNASNGGIPTGNVVNWPAIDSLANGAVTNFTVTVQAPASGSFTNTASATSSTGDPVPSNNDGSSSNSIVTTTVTPQADVAVSKSGPATVTPGTNLTYTITVTNMGPSTASNVVVSDMLPLNVTFVSATGGGLLSSNVVNWPTIASLTNGAATNFTVTVKAPASGSFTNRAHAVSSTVDPNMANNDGTGAGSQVITAVTGPQFGILGGAIALNPQTGLYEQRVTITNSSASTVAAVRLNVGGLRTGVRLYNASGTNGVKPFVQYNAPLNPGQTVVFTLEYYVPDRKPFTSVLDVEAVLPAQSAPAQGNGLSITRSFIDTRIAGNPRLVIEFATVPGKTYTIIYSDDNLQTWKVATPSVTATANVTQWYDDGPPKTDSSPSQGGNRFYRVIVAN